MNPINRFLLIFIIYLLIKSIECKCKKENNQISTCLTNDGLKILCLCKDNQNSNETTIFRQSVQFYLECHLKLNLTLIEYLNRKLIKLIGELCDSLNAIDYFEINKKKELDQIRLDERSNEIKLNNSIIYHLTNYFEAKYLILIGFLISLILILIVWCILYCCQKAHSSSNLAASDLFISSTPNNSYSPVNSLPNASPIALHNQDQVRAALLDDSMFSVDVINYEDLKPPSYDDAMNDAIAYGKNNNN